MPATDATLAALLASQAATHAQRAALRWDREDPLWTELDYATLAERAQALADRLLVQRGLRVAWLGFNHPA